MIVKLLKPKIIFSLLLVLWCVFEGIECARKNVVAGKAKLTEKSRRQIGKLALKDDGTIIPAATQKKDNSKLVRNKRIVGSSNVPVDVPYHVAVTNASNAICGGSIIAPKWVLTAAHCITSGIHNIRAGSRNLNSGGTLVTVSKVIKHPGFDPETFENDIALLQLSTSLQFTAKITSVKLLLSGKRNMTGFPATFSGWGKLGNGVSANAYWVNTTVISNPECATAWDDWFYPTTMICTSTVGGQGTCDDYGGGPSVVTIRGVKRQLCVASHPSSLCEDDKPTVHTRVSNYIPWIKTQTKLTLT